MDGVTKYGNKKLDPPGVLLLPPRKPGKGRVVVVKLQFHRMQIVLRKTG